MADIMNKFKEHLGVDEKTFYSILFHGFYYYDEKSDDIYWESNAVFIGNGECPHSCNMISTFPLSMDAHAFDWTKEDKVFNFENYGKTWSINEDDLKHLLKNQNSVRVYFI